jgi:hypothetical protein
LDESQVPFERGFAALNFLKTGDSPEAISAPGAEPPPLDFRIVSAGGSSPLAVRRDIMFRTPAVNDVILCSLLEIVRRHRRRERESSAGILE